MFGDPIFLPVAIFKCKQADIEWILNKVSKNYRLKIPCPGGGVGEGFHIRFLCKRSKQYVEFKGLLHIFFYLFPFRLT